MVTRRRFLLGAGASGALAATGAGGLLSACTPPPPGGPIFTVPPGDGPNIVMFSVDDLNDYVGFLGGYAGSAHTPNIDALAASGLAFHNAYGIATLTLPSRAAMLWCLDPTTTGINDSTTADHNRYGSLIADGSKQTLPEVLADDGYHTLNTGKIFESALTDRWHTTAPYPSTLALQTPVGPDRFSYEVLPPGEKHPDQATADWFRGRLAATYDRPFFMAVGFFQPHPPWRVPQSAFDHHPLGGVQLPPTVLGDLDDMPPPAQALADAPLSNYQAVQNAGTHELIVQAYLAAATHSDAMVGQVMNDLASSPFANTTNVMLWSDHGYHLGEHFHFRKSALWEQTTHVPFIVSGPGVASGVFSRPVSLLDMAPTVIDLAGAPMPAAWEGSSLVGITEAEADNRPVRTHHAGHRTLRWKTWRYTRYSDATEELYDQATDPEEFTNLAGNPAYAAEKAQLAAMI